MFSTSNCLSVFFLCTIFFLNVSSKQSRIIGGEVANAGQFPWAAAIYKSTSDGSYFCGGGLISDEWVLTAGQCVDGGILFTITLGSTKLQGDENIIRVSTDTYFLHPEYNPQTLENDIALIKFRQPVTLTMYIGRIYLPFYEVQSGFEVTAVGWGQISDVEAGVSNDLNWVELTALSNEECRLFYGDQIKDNMLCVAGQYNEGTCYGDTGGMLSRDFGISAQTIIGISSFVSSDGCESLNPSGYTRSYPYLNWILNHTGLL